MTNSDQEFMSQNVTLSQIEQKVTLFVARFHALQLLAIWLSLEIKKVSMNQKWGIVRSKEIILFCRAKLTHLTSHLISKASHESRTTNEYQTHDEETSKL